jgi:hypothetical protein
MTIGGLVCRREVGEAQPWWRMRRLLPRFGKRSKAASVPPNIYRRGLWASFREVLLPGRVVEQHGDAAASRLQPELSGLADAAATAKPAATGSGTLRPRTRRSAAAEAGSTGQRQ